MKIQAESGETVYELAKRAIQEAQRRNCGVGMTHNDITVSVYPESYIHDICEKFHYLREFSRLNNKK